jgi:hypothetical protein
MLWFPAVYTTLEDGKCAAEVYDSETMMVIGSVKAGETEKVYAETERLLSFVKYVSESPLLMEGYVLRDQEKGQDEPGT